MNPTQWRAQDFGKVRAQIDNYPPNSTVFRIWPRQLRAHINLVPPLSKPAGGASDGIRPHDILGSESAKLNNQSERGAGGLPKD